MLRRHLALGLALSASLVLGLAGCGDDGEDAVPTSTTAAATTTAPDGSEPAATTTTSTTTTTAEGADPEPAAGDEAFCAAFAAFNVSSETHPSETLADVQAGSAELAGHAEDMDAAAPDDLADEAETFAATFVQLRDDVAVAASLEEATSKAQALSSDPEFSAAIQTISMWAAEACAR